MFCLTTVTLRDKPKKLFARMICYVENLSVFLDRTLNNIPHLCLNTDVSSNDTFTLTKMLKQDDISEFVKVMVKEVADH